MSVRSALLLAQLAVLSPTESVPNHAAIASIRNRLESRELQFLISWGDAYRLSQVDGQYHRLNYSPVFGQLYNRQLNTRQVFWHCHFNNPTKSADIEAPAKYAIPSAYNIGYSVCPSWWFQQRLTDEALVWTRD